MELLLIVFAILIAGVLVWGIDQIDAIDAMFKKLAKVLIIVTLVIYVLVVLYGFLVGHFPALGSGPGRLR